MSCNRRHPIVLPALLLANMLQAVLLPITAKADPVIRDFQQVPFFDRTDSENIEDKTSEWIYEALDNPNAMENKLARGAAYGALDLVGMATPVKALVEELGDAAEFEFGDCTEMKLRDSLAAETCLDGGASVELDADYDLQGLQLKYHWRF